MFHPRDVQQASPVEVWSLLLLVACAEPSRVVPLPPATTSFDLALGDRDARLFVQGDITGRCTLRNPFPAPGTCHHASDVRDCDREAATCLESVAIDAQMIAVTGPEQHLAWSLTPRVARQLTITGCGRQVELELSADPLPAPVIQRIFRAPAPSVEWTQDLPAASSIVSMGPFSQPVQGHIAAAQMFAFENCVGISPREIEIRSLAAVDTVETELGQIRIGAAMLRSECWTRRQHRARATHPARNADRPQSSRRGRSCDDVTAEYRFLRSPLRLSEIDDGKADLVRHHRSAARTSPPG